MKKVGVEEAEAQSLAWLGLTGAHQDMASEMALGQVLRRVASMKCPCSHRSIVSATVDCLNTLGRLEPSLEETVEEALESLLAYGDLVEGAPPSGSAYAGQILVHLGIPSFVLRESGVIFLMGQPPDGQEVVSGATARAVVFDGLVRKLNSADHKEAQAGLVSDGLIKLDSSSWLRSPKAKSASDYVAQWDEVLNAAPPCGAVEGFEFMDPSESVNYYRGRWTSPRRHSGRVVGRRKQAFGSPLWCYAEVTNGLVLRLVDLPEHGASWRGCDSGWLLSMAIDAVVGRPQEFGIDTQNRPDALLTFNGPLPGWARRRLGTVGREVKAPRCLVAFSIPFGELPEETAYLASQLWLRPVTDQRSP